MTHVQNARDIRRRNDDDKRQLIVGATACRVLRIPFGAVGVEEVVLFPPIVPFFFDGVRGIGFC